MRDSDLDPPTTWPFTFPSLGSSAVQRAAVGGGCRSVVRLPGSPRPPRASLSAVADVLQLEFLPEGNNEEVLAGWRGGPLLLWRLRRDEWLPSPPARPHSKCPGPIPLTTPARGQAAPALPTLKPIKQVWEQFLGQSRLCLCQTLMNAHFFFFAFLGPFSPPAEASPTLNALNLVSFHSETDSWDSVEVQWLLLGEAG